MLELGGSGGGYSAKPQRGQRAFPVFKVTSSALEEVVLGSGDRRLAGSEPWLP